MANMNLAKKTVLHPVESSDDPRDVAWHNLTEADKTLELSFLVGAMRGYFNSHPNSSYQELESGFRKRNFNTYLIAREPSVPITADGEHNLINLANKEVASNTDGNLRFEVTFSVRPNPFAMEQLLTVWPSYDENYKALKFAGNLNQKGYEIDVPAPQTHANDHVFESDKHKILFKISFNQAKISFIDATPRETLEKIQRELEQKGCKNVKIETIAVQDDTVIIGLVIGRTVVSDTGCRVFPGGRTELVRIQRKIA